MIFQIKINGEISGESINREKRDLGIGYVCRLIAIFARGCEIEVTVKNINCAAEHGIRNAENSADSNWKHADEHYTY